MYIYIYTHTHTYFSTYVHTYTYIYTYIHTQTKNIHIYIHTYIHTHILTYLNTYIHTHIHKTYIHNNIHTYIRTHIYIHTCIHNYIYMHTHIDIQTHKYMIHAYVYTQLVWRRAHRMLTIGSHCQTHYALPIYKQQTIYWQKPLVLVAVQCWTAGKVLWREECSCGNWRAICLGRYWGGIVLLDRRLPLTSVRLRGHVASKCGMLNVRDMHLFLEVERRRVRAETWAKEGTIANEEQEDVITSASVTSKRVQVCFIVIDDINHNYHFCLCTKFFLFSQLKFCATLNTFHMTTSAQCHVTVDF